MAELDSADSRLLRDRIDAALKAAESEYRRIESDSGHDRAEAEIGVRVATLRLIACAVRDRDVSARIHGDCDGCPEETVRKVLETMAAQRRESAAEFDDAGRIADAEREREELEVIESFLPEPLAAGDLEAAVQDVVEDLDARNLKDLGRCISTLKKRYPGRIDPRKAGPAVRRALG